VLAEHQHTLRVHLCSSSSRPAVPMVLRGYCRSASRLHQHTLRVHCAAQSSRPFCAHGAPELLPGAGRMTISILCVSMVQHHGRHAPPVPMQRARDYCRSAGKSHQHTLRVHSAAQSEPSACVPRSASGLLPGTGPSKHASACHSAADGRHLFVPMVASGLPPGASWASAYSTCPMSAAR
jgi:hypothetical protein